MENAKRFKRISKNTFIYGCLAIWFVVCVFPFFWAFLTSIKYPVDAFAIPPKWSFEPTFDSYKELWVNGQFTHFLTNTFVVTAATVIIAIVIGCPAGYALARYTKSSGFFLLLMALVFRALPHTLFILPFYFIARQTGLFDTRILLVGILVAMNQPFTIWMLRSFFKNIPVALEEASMIDGCTRFQAFRKVILPIMGPGVITSAIFTLMLAYNEYFIPVVLTASRAETMTVAIASFGIDSVREWTTTAAGAVSISIPVIFIVIFAQKYIVKGLTAGAVKE